MDRRNLNNFAIMAMLVKCVKRNDDDSWIVETDIGSIVGAIGIDRNCGGYQVFIGRGAAWPVSECETFMSALSKLIPAMRKAINLEEERIDALKFLCNIRGRIEFFLKNPKADRFIIALADAHGKGTAFVNYALLRNDNLAQVNTMHWHDLHHERLSKDILMYITSDEAQHDCTIARETHFKYVPSGNVDQIQTKRFSEALAATSDYFGFKVMEINRKLINLAEWVNK